MASEKILGEGKGRPGASSCYSCMYAKQAQGKIRGLFVLVCVWCLHMEYIVRWLVNPVQDVRVLVRVQKSKVVRACREHAALCSSERESSSGASQHVRGKPAGPRKPRHPASEIRIWEGPLSSPPLHDADWTADKGPAPALHVIGSVSWRPPSGSHGQGDSAMSSFWCLPVAQGSGPSPCPAGLGYENAHENKLQQTNKPSRDSAEFTILATTL